MKREDDEKLWDLLGRSAEPQVSPFFARNVLRKIRNARGESTPSWFDLRWLVPASGVAVAVIAALSFRMEMPGRNQSNPPSDKVALIEGQDSELLADLDDLVAADDNSGLDDAVLL
jgi:hypothetical protein